MQGPNITKDKVHALHALPVGAVRSDHHVTSPGAGVEKAQGNAAGCVWGLEEVASLPKYQPQKANAFCAQFPAQLDSVDHHGTRPRRKAR